MANETVAVDDKGTGDAGAVDTGKEGSGTVLDASKESTRASEGGDKGSAGTGDVGSSKAIWPDDWQRRIAGDDEKELKQISRYATPADIWKKARALEQRLSSGDLKPALPKDPKPEELAAWRKDHGIPDKPEGYDLKDLKVTKAEKETVDNVLKHAHAAHMTPDQARAAVDAFYAERNRIAEARAAKDDEQRIKTLDALNQEWGGSFRRNVNMVEGVLAKFPKSVVDALKSARLPDGTAAFNNPDVLRGFAGLALELNPTGIVVPSSGGDIGKSMIDRYAEINKLMREDRKAYDKDQNLQNEYQGLIDTLLKHKLIDGNGKVKMAA